MARNRLQSVDGYIAAQPETMQAVLRLVRDTIRKSVPQAEELISYNIPTYKLQGSPVLYFAGWKRHFSLYPATVNVINAFQDEVTPYLVSKSTLRFPLAQPVPLKLIGRIAKFRANEIAEKP